MATLKAITGKQKDRAVEIYVDQAYKKLRATAKVDIPTLEAGVAAIDDWFNASPVGDTALTRAASLDAALSGTLKGGTTTDERTILVGGWAGALAEL